MVELVTLVGGSNDGVKIKIDTRRRLVFFNTNDGNGQLTEERYDFYTIVGNKGREFYIGIHESLKFNEALDLLLNRYPRGAAND